MEDLKKRGTDVPHLFSLPRGSIGQGDVSNPGETGGGRSPDPKTCDAVGRRAEEESAIPQCQTEVCGENLTWEEPSPRMETESFGQGKIQGPGGKV